MDALYRYLLEVPAGSGILIGAYVLLLEKRTSFRICRTYLVATTLWAAVVPLLKIPLWKGEAYAAGQVTVGTLTATLPADASTQVTWNAAILGIWIAGVLILGSEKCRQIWKIRALRRTSPRTTASGYSIVPVQKSIGSFSFLGTIYLQEGIPESQQAHIIAHEASHIRHRHTTERLVMEGLKVLFWWNPFVRVAARKLIEVHEFEADRDVLRQGFSASAYADTLFGQLFGYNPDIANGLYDSLIKKRFQMMTNNSSGRHSLLRMAATLPAIVGIVCAFAFTTRTTDLTEPLRTPEIPAARATGAETTSSVAGETPDKPFLVVETMPRFQQGGLNDFRNWVTAQISYPKEAIDSNLSGRVIVKFVVEKDGSLSSIEIAESPGEILSKEVIRILNLSPKWTPGMQRGQKVRVQHTLPITFNL